jgi:hypothetical protein
VVREETFGFLGLFFVLLVRVASKSNVATAAAANEVKRKTENNHHIACWRRVGVLASFAHFLAAADPRPSAAILPFPVSRRTT